LYDGFAADAKELLLEKDRDIHAIEKNHLFIVEKYEKRLKALEQKIFDLQEVYSVLNCAGTYETNIQLDRNSRRTIL